MEVNFSVMYMRCQRSDYMKVIDMLDRIAKGEEVKFKIMETDEVLNLTKDMHLFSITYNEPIEWFIDEEWLNYEVEIIEEDKKIEKLYEISNIGDLMIKYPDNKQLMDKINEIIDYINKGI